MSRLEKAGRRSGYIKSAQVVTIPPIPGPDVMKVCSAREG